MNMDELIKPEIKFMCRFLNDTCDEELFNQVDPQELLLLLKQHSLYPVFYKKWNLHLWSKSDPNWMEFTATLRKLAHQNRIRMMEKTALLLKLTERFADKGIPVISLKGPALAQRIYGDIAMRVSTDLDILVKADDFFIAAKILESAGFQNKYITKGFTRKQSNYFFKKYRHLEFTSLSDKTRIELHWQLNHLGNRKGTDIGAIMSNAEFVLLGDQKVRVLSEADEFSFLLIHGLSHSFHRLQWLYDLHVYNDKYRGDLRNKSLYDAYIVCQKLLFNKDSLGTIEHVNRFTVHFLKTITKPVPRYHVLRNWNDAYGRILLSKNLKDTLQVFSAQLTSPKDWYLLTLNDRFFFMYFILRPFLGLSRFFKRQEVK